MSSRDESLIKEAIAWFVRISSGDTTESDQRAFNAWIERDPAHRAAYAEAEALWADLGKIHAPRRGPDWQPPVPGMIAPPGSLRRGGHRIQWSAAVGACIALIGLIGMWSMGGGYDELRADHKTGVGEIRQVTLQDGSVIHLNTRTALGVDFTDTCRCLTLYRGEAFFAVANDQTRPFLVKAGTGATRAVGTAFNVRDRDQAVTVGVTEGRVLVLREEGGQSATGNMRLSAGESARYVAGGEIRKYNADVTALTAWRQGKLVFVDRALREVVAELDRYRPGSIIFLDSAISDKRFTGVINLHDTDHALTAIERTLQVDVVRITPYLTLLRTRH